MTMFSQATAALPQTCLAVGEISGLATLADWFGRLILRPMDAATAAANRTDEMLDVIAGFGDAFGVPAAANAMIAFLRQHSPNEIERRLGYRYVVLFDGVGGKRTVSLCENAHAEGGEPLLQTAFASMQAILRTLDVSVDGTCREPADHLAIELAALAEALRQGNVVLTEQLVQRISRWVPAVAEAVCHADPSDADQSEFYAAVFELLAAFIADLAASLGEGCQKLSGVSYV